MCQLEEWAMLFVAFASLALDILKTLRTRRRNDGPSDGSDT
jgi:hypothetical protein